LGGIRAAEGAVAFNKIDIKPEVVGDVTFANTSYNSPYGMIKSEWKKIANGFEIDVQIPANTTATIYLPAQEKSVISESGTDMQAVDFKNGRSAIKVGSGNYKFRVSN
jgi:hypothetical protein